MGKTVNKRRTMYAVTFVETRTGTPLDVLDSFVDWTKRKHLRSYIEIGKMLHVTPNEANRLLCLATLPDDVTVKRMKELMNGKQR